MSVVATSWVWEQTELSAADTLVLLALADMADEQHSCYPGQKLLAARARIGQRSVRRHLADLEAAGYIRRLARYRHDADGGRTSDRYVLAVGEPITAVSPEPLTGHSDRGGLPDTGDRVSGHQRPGYRTPATGQEPPEEPSEEPLGRARKARRATGAPDEFPVTDQMRFWAKAHGVTVNLTAETEHWLDHHRARGTEFKDWAAAWRTWMDRSKRYGPSTAPPGPSPTSSRSPWAQ